MVDTGWQGVPGWEQLPNWIAAIATVLALGAAVFAGAWARQAALHTKAQADASDEQVKIAREALEHAREEAQAARADADVQRQEAERAHRRLDESRLDARAPTIYARAVPVPTLQNADGRMLSFLEYSERVPGSAPGGNVWSDQEPVCPDFAVDSRFSRMVVFQCALTITLKNLSDHIALVEIADLASGKVEPWFNHLVIEPHAEHLFIWKRYFAAQDSALRLSTEPELQNQENWSFNFTFLVRDLGRNVRDTCVFDGDLRFFTRAGS